MSTTKKANTKTVQKKTHKKQIVKQPKILPEDAKLRKKPRYRSFRLHKRVKHHGPPLPSWWGITKKAGKLLRVNARSIFWFSLIYGLLYLVLVRGFTAGVDVDGIRELFDEVEQSNVTTFVTNVSIFGLIVQATTSAAGDVAGLYQLFLLIISSLALIWLFRQQQAGNKVSMKEAFYRGMYPLIPFVLVVCVIGLQIIPATIGNFLFETVVQTGIAVNTLEQVIWFLLFISLVILSLYLISSSLIALLIVTLPEMTPMLALKKAKELVTFRRVSVLRKIVVLLFFLLAMYVSIVFPILFISATAAQVVFFILSIVTVPFSVAYIFVLYRELL